MVLVAKFAHTLGKRGITGSTPPSPCTGSKITAQVRSEICFSKAPMSLKGRWVIAPGRGPKPEEYLSCPPTQTVKKRAAVETVREGDDFILLLAVVVKSGSAGELERSFIGFGAGVCKKHPVKPRE